MKLSKLQQKQQEQHLIKVLRALTVSGIMRWNECPEGLKSEIGMFQIKVECSGVSRSIEEPVLSVHADYVGGTQTSYNYGFRLPEVIRL